MSYKYICPSCGKEIEIKRESTYNFYIQEKRVCANCRKKEKDLEMNLFRYCPKCGSKLHYKCKTDYLNACRTNRLCVKCCNNSGRFKPLELKYPNKRNTPTYTLDKLLDETIISFYWLGLIISDGSFYNGRFEISLSEKDYDYLIEFANYIGFDTTKIMYREKTSSYRLLFGNQKNINSFMEHFGIRYKKTYNPIDYDNIFRKYTIEQKLALLVGIIDGDGNINKDSKSRYSINITAHHVWKDFYEKLIKDVGIDFNIHRLNNCNAIRISTAKQCNVKKLLQFVNDNNILYLKRKWNKIVY